MPQVELTVEQLVEAVKRLAPAEKAEVLRTLQDAGDMADTRESRLAWLEELRGIRELTSTDPTSWADAIIEDRADRI